MSEEQIEVITLRLYFLSMVLAVLARALPPQEAAHAIQASAHASSNSWGANRWPRPPRRPWHRTWRRSLLRCSGADPCTTAARSAFDGQPRDLASHRTLSPSGAFEAVLASRPREHGGA